MNMFARFDEIPEMTFQDIKETKRHGQTDGWMDGRTHRLKTVCGGIKKFLKVKSLPLEACTYFES